MDRILRCVALAGMACAVFLSAQTPEKKPNIAVTTLKNASGVQAGEAEIISDRMRAELFNTGKVNVMEREQMQEILKEQGFQASGACTDEACLVEMGQLLGVQKIITGSIGKLGSMFMLNLREIDVQTGRISKAVSKDINGDIEEVVGILDDIAREILSSIPGPVKPEVKKPVPVVQEKVEEPPEEQPEAPPEEEAKEEEPAQQPEVDLSAVDKKKERNKNRFGIHLGFNIYPGDFVEEIQREYAYNTQWDETQTTDPDIFDRSNVSPTIDLEFKGILKAGPVITIDIGAGWRRAEMSLSSTWTSYPFDTTRTWVTNANVFSVLLNPNFVKRIFPIKINAGLVLGLDFLNYSENYTRTQDDLYGYSYYLNDTTYTFRGFALSYGARGGAEVMAGTHVGFSFDFLFRFSRFTTFPLTMDYPYEDSYGYTQYDSVDETRTVMLPMVGLGMGVNFYF